MTVELSTLNLQDSKVAYVVEFLVCFNRLETFKNWKKNQPEIEDEIIIDEKDEVIADLSVQLLEAQSSIKSIEKDVANLSILMLEGDTDA